MDRSTDLNIQELKVRGPAAAALAFRSAALASPAQLAATRLRWSSRPSRGTARGHLRRGVPGRSAPPRAADTQAVGCPSLSRAGLLSPS